MIHYAFHVATKGRELVITTGSDLPNNIVPDLPTLLAVAKSLADGIVDGQGIDVTVHLQWQMYQVKSVLWASLLMSGIAIRHLVMHCWCNDSSSDFSTRVVRAILAKKIAASLSCHPQTVSITGLVRNPVWTIFEIGGVFSSPRLTTLTVTLSIGLLDAVEASWNLPLLTDLTVQACNTMTRVDMAKFLSAVQSRLCRPLARLALWSTEGLGHPIWLSAPLLTPALDLTLERVRVNSDVRVGCLRINSLAHGGSVRATEVTSLIAFDNLDQADVDGIAACYELTHIGRPLQPPPALMLPPSVLAVDVQSLGQSSTFTRHAASPTDPQCSWCPSSLLLQTVHYPSSDGPHPVEERRVRFFAPTVASEPWARMRLLLRCVSGTPEAESRRQIVALAYGMAAAGTIVSDKVLQNILMRAFQHCT